MNALFLSGVGFLSYIARDPQARSITFWSLGTLSGANWQAVLLLTAAIAVGLAIALRHARHLNALMMGEDEARYLGVEVAKLKVVITAVNVVIVAVAFFGVYFFGVDSTVGWVLNRLFNIFKH